MARQLRVEFAGAIYHVTCRMIGDWRTEKTLLFRDDADRERLLARLSERVEQYGIRLYLFVLMTNHFHLVFETPEANCSKFMQSLLTAYTVYYNLRHRRHGHLLDGRFKAKLVAGDAYLLALSRYVHLNPVQVGPMKDQPLRERTGHLRRYPWSSYPSYIGLRKPLAYVDYGPMLGGMGGPPRDRPKRYRTYVEAGLAETDTEFKEALERSPRSIGSDAFRAWVDARYQELAGIRGGSEDISFRRITEPLPSQEVLELVAGTLSVEVDAFRQRRRNSLLRAVAAHFLCRYAGLTQRDAAAVLGVGSGAAISHQLRKLATVLSGDARLRRLLRQAEQRLEERRRETR